MKATSRLSTTIAVWVGLTALTMGLLQAAPAPLTWEAAVAQAVSNHPSMVASAQAEDAAAAALERANAAYAPQLTLAAKPIGAGNYRNGKYEDYIDGEARLTAGLTTPMGVSGSATVAYNWQDDLTAGRPSLTLAAGAGLDPKARLYASNRLAVKRARQNLQKATWDRKEQEKATAIGVLSTFWDLELDLRRLRITQQMTKEKTGNHLSMLKRQEQGLAGPTDVLTTEIALRQAEATEYQATAEYQARLATFARDLQLPEPPELGFSGGFPEKDLHTGWDTSLLEKAVCEHSLAANKRSLDLEYATLELEQAKAGLWPDISLSVSYSLPDLTELTGPEASRWGASANIQLPLADGGRRRSTISEKEQQVQSAQEQIARALEDAVNSLHSTLIQWEQARHSVEIARLKLKKTRLEEELIKQQYTTGLATEGAWLASQRSLELAAIDLQAAINAQGLLELEIAAMTGNRLEIDGRPLLP